MPRRQIGPYAIQEVLGAGAAGVVYLARDTRSQQEVALKVVSATGAAAATRLRRFQREAAALRQLRHPNLVAVFDAGEAGGAGWLAMERVPGVTLEELLGRGPLPIDEVVGIGRQLADGLAEAHRQGIVHRDVKPDNVVVAPDGRAVLTDFGLAKDLEIEESRRLSQSGALLGTPGYWAPEQARGEGASAAPPIDVYGVGATLYAALVGGPPFDGGSLVEVVVATVEQRPEPPSRRRADVPGWLEQVVLRCLAKDPARRYADAGELARALRQVVARPTTRRRGPRLAGAILAGGGLAALAVVAAAGAGSDATREDVEVQRSASPAEGDEAAAPAPVSWRVPYEAGDAAAAASLVRSAAEAGDVEAMTALGALLAAGAGGDRDEAEAAAWFLRAAEAGHPPAMFERAVMEREGLGVRRDPARGDARLREAAEAGHPPAMRVLSVLLARAGRPEEGARWLRRAAEAGDVDAMFELGFCLSFGQSMPADEREGREWLGRLAATGDGEEADLARNALRLLDGPASERLGLAMRRPVPARPTLPPAPAGP